MQKGEVISGRFEVEHLSGAGGMGQVYRARDLQTGEPVALKVLYQVGAVEIERFAREAELLAGLRHPGIVRYISGGAIPGGGPYLAMEWLEGEPLSERLKRMQLTVGESLALGVRVASALAAVHHRNVVHRDLKPSNIFLRGGAIDDVKLIDFGIAWRPDGNRQLTIPGAMLGTPGYIAPEQAHGVPDIDARADIFSLGCVLFRCLSGRAPFHGSDALSVLLKVAADEPPRLRELRPAVPPDLDDLVARMLSKSRDARPYDGSAVAEALQAIEDLVPLSSGVISVPRGAPSELTGVERRVMSLVLARRPDAEATLPVSESGVRDRAIRAVAERHRGKLEVLADGSLLVLLSTAEAATDLAARAARCALALRSLLDGAPVVIVSGRELVGLRLPTGELIDHAVELLRSPALGREGGFTPNPGSSSAPEIAFIRLDEVTAGLLGPGFDVEAGASGFSLRGERSELDGQRPLLGKPTACVGRERELVQLEALFDQCVEERMASAVLVTAPAGLGKSRLVHEFLRKLRVRGDVVEVWFGQGDSMSAGSAFGILARALRRAAGILDGESIEVRRRKLRERVSRRLGADAERVTVLLGELIGTSFADEGDPLLLALRHDPIVLGEQMRRAFLTFLRAECAAQPLLLVLEDLQWGDLPTVRFIDAALDDLRELPLMALAVGRPDVHAIFPRLWAARGAQEIRLRELSRRASERLVRQVLGDSVGHDTMESLIGRADGHAFYLEELIRAVATGKGTELPETVLAMVQARLERLDPQARRVLRAASLFGETFWRGGVEALLGATGANAWLGELCEQEVIAVKDHGRFPGEVEFRFRHSLVREAAYGMLTEADRTLGHRLAGEWLEQVGENDAMVLGEHFERGGERDGAVAWFLRAAEQALEGGDLDAVVARAARALASGATGVVKGVLLGMQGYVHTWRTDYVASAAVYGDALPDLPAGSVHWHLAIGGALHAAASLGDVARVVSLIETLRAGLREETGPIAPMQGMSAAVPILCVAGQYELARDFIRRFSIDETGGSNRSRVIRAGEPGGDATASGTKQRSPSEPWTPSSAPYSASAGLDVARCHYAFFAAGDPWALRAHAGAALARGQRVGEPRVIHMAQAYGGIALVKLGAIELGEQRLREARAASASRGLRLVGQFADFFLADALTNRGALDEATAVLAECRETAAQSALWAGVWSISSARIARRQRDFDGAQALLRSALAVCGSLSPGYFAHATGILGKVELERGGDRAEAAALTKAALQRLDTIETWCNDISIRVSCAESLHMLGDDALARSTLAAARAQIEARAAVIDDAGFRASYLEDVPENARAFAFSRAWGDDSPPA
jgi:eukaryotic-like serine/threonine-protein kinase